MCHPPLPHYPPYGEISTNQMGDVCPHLQGVEGIKFLCFPNLGPTEATEQHSLSAAQSPTQPVSYGHTFCFSLCSFRSAHTYLIQFFRFWRFHALFHFLSRSPDIIACRGSCNAQRASRVTCCLPACVSEPITIQHLNALLLDHC